MYKKILVLLSAFILSISTVYAYDSTDYELGERTSDNNYGVNKNITSLDSKMNNILSVPYVDSSYKIYDYADVLTDDEEDELREKINVFENESHMSLVVWINRFSSSISDSSFNMRAADFYDYNDFGIDYQNYSGCIFIRDPYNRMDDIVCTGDAMRYYDSERLADINSYIDYSIRNDQYYNLVNQLISRFNYWYNKGLPSSADYTYIDDNGELVHKFRPPYLVDFIVSCLITAIVVGILIAKNKMIHKAKNADEYLDKSSIKYLRREDHFIGSHTTSYTVDSGSGGGGGHSGGGSFHGSSGISHSSGGVHHR